MSLSHCFTDAQINSPESYELPSFHPMHQRCSRPRPEKQRMEVIYEQLTDIVTLCENNVLQIPKKKYLSLTWVHSKSSCVQKTQSLQRGKQSSVTILTTPTNPLSTHSQSILINMSGQTGFNTFHNWNMSIFGCYPYHLSFRWALHCKLLKHFFGLGDVLVYVISKQHCVRHLLHGLLVAFLCYFNQLFI